MDDGFVEHESTDAEIVQDLSIPNPSVEEIRSEGTETAFFDSGSADTSESSESSEVSFTFPEDAQAESTTTLDSGTSEFAFEVNDGTDEAVSDSSLASFSFEEFAGEAELEQDDPDKGAAIEIAADVAQDFDSEAAPQDTPVSEEESATSDSDDGPGDVELRVFEGDETASLPVANTLTDAWVPSESSDSPSAGEADASSGWNVRDFAEQIDSAKNGDDSSPQPDDPVDPVEESELDWDASSVLSPTNHLKKRQLPLRR